MKHIRVLAAVLALALAAFTGTAVAGGDNGNAGGNSGSPPGQESAPGQEKKAEPTAQPQPAPAQPAPAQQANAPAKSSGKSSAAPGQAKKSSTSTKQSTHTSSHTSSHGVNATTQGVKPSSATSKNQWTKVGASPNVSKRYGNGQTAAGIAKSRGAPDNTDIYGPGNSQPHKVCGKNGHFVDVHAVKSYVGVCAGTQSTQQSQQPTKQVQQQSGCPATSTVTSTRVTGIWHLNGKGEKVHLMTNPKSAHFRGKHGDHETATETVTQSIVTGSGSCAQAQQVTQQQTSQTAAATSNVSNASASSQPASSGAVAAGTQPSAGGVLGVQATVKSKAKPAGGVLGTAGRVAGTSLPFTGLPLWSVVLAAAALLAGGLLVRRLATARN
jgi:hypothetical protein